MLVAFARSSCVSKTTLSPERWHSPVAESTAPPVAEELSQPRPGLEGGFAQGQSMTLARPGSQALVKKVKKRSRRKMSV